MHTHVKYTLSVKQWTQATSSHRDAIPRILLLRAHAPIGQRRDIIESGGVDLFSNIVCRCEGLFAFLLLNDSLSNDLYVCEIDLVLRLLGNVSAHKFDQTRGSLCRSVEMRYE